MVLEGLRNLRCEEGGDLGAAGFGKGLWGGVGTAGNVDGVRDVIGLESESEDEERIDE